MPPYHESTTADHSSNASCASIPHYSPTTPLCAAAVRASCCSNKDALLDRSFVKAPTDPRPRDRAVSKKQTLTQARGTIAAASYTPSFGALPMASFVIW